ncbi:hypothetical protein BDA96_10G167000 [Sorghum bicolor]|uniref:Uncharacterized protein n=1 Tax=Sorghum bicolor TaxID=4558 RepID=A0A921U158_SORBI|nr:hypothetical protein BDA96_10G167000 [Sorghum bicolor]
MHRSNKLTIRKRKSIRSTLTVPRSARSHDGDDKEPKPAWPFSHGTANGRQRETGFSTMRHSRWQGQSSPTCSWQSVRISLVRLTVTGTEVAAPSLRAVDEGAAGGGRGVPRWSAAGQMGTGGGVDGASAGALGARWMRAAGVGGAVDADRRSRAADAHRGSGWMGGRGGLRGLRV